MTDTDASHRPIAIDHADGAGVYLHVEPGAERVGDDRELPIVKFPCPLSGRRA
jgi:hypothetical protein